MTAIISGSLAFDTIMVFNDRFRNHILPDQVHILNVSFLVPQLRKEFGGCAGNIAYNLSLLGERGYPLGAVGHDFDGYRAWLERYGISCEYVRVLPDTYTAQAYITTDEDDNQITAFHPGAMNHAHEQRVPTDAGISLGMVSPDGRDGMLEHAEQFADAGIPFIFDPGQGLPMFNGEELRRFLHLASYVAVNEYEFEMLRERTGLSQAEIAAAVDACIVTNGARGSQIHTAAGTIDIPVATPQALADPTGCGDAYRAGLIYGMQRGLDWETTGRIASLMGTLKIERPGTQNHSFSHAEFGERYKAAFGVELVLAA